MSEFEGTPYIPGVTGEGEVGNEYLMPRAYMPLQGPKPPEEPVEPEPGRDGGL